MTRAGVVMALLVAGCGGDPPAAPTAETPEVIQSRPANVDPRVVERAPSTFAALALPGDVGRSFAWVGADGEALVVARDGRFFRVDAYGTPALVARIPGEAPVAADAPVAGLLERSPGEVLALVPSGALRLYGGWVERVAFPPLLAAATARCAWGDESLWATPAGVYTTHGTSWLRLDREGAPVTDATQVLPARASAGAREAWVLGSGGALRKLRVESAAAGVAVRWSDPVPGLLLDRVRAVAVHNGARYVSRSGDLLRVTADGALQRVRIPGIYAGPFAMASAGPWLWMVWEGNTDAALARFDGADRLEVLGRGGPWEAPALSAGGPGGGVAVITDGATATRVVVEPAVRVLGLREGEAVVRPRVSLWVEPPSPSLVEAVEFSLDGARVSAATAAPFAWGEAGATERELSTLEFGDHQVTVNVRYRGAAPLRVTRGFRYLSPLGRVPTYERDIRELYEARCARCHSANIGRDLDGYARLAAQATLVADAMESRRMPPDLAVDAATIQIVTAWAAGGARER